jgi:hypothetical protein
MLSVKANVCYKVNKLSNGSGSKTFLDRRVITCDLRAGGCTLQSTMRCSTVKRAPVKGSDVNITENKLC